MSRELRAVVGGKTLPGWVMICNGCWTTHSDVRPAQQDLPLKEFADAGWYIGEVADWCPACVEQVGGITATVKHVRPHRLMAPAGGLGMLHSPELWAPLAPAGGSR